MDDLRTKETLDALADLFLTGTTPPARKPPTAPLRTPPRKAFDDSDLTPHVIVTNQALDKMSAAGPSPSSPISSFPSELDGPGSISIGARHTSASRYAEEYDDAPAPPLRLHDENNSTIDDTRAPQPSHIEAVFLGNLPGFGGPWLTQYAYHVAQQRGPVALLRITGDHVDLELITAQRQTIRPGLDDAIAPGSDVNAMIARLDQLLRDSALPVANWLIHLPTPTDPAQLLRAAAIAHWTILCGGDDMAVAGATRMLQNMMLSATTAPDTARLVGVMIMGSDEAKAREAIDKFNAAASSFLRQPIELIGSRRQMTPVHMRPLGSATGNDVWPAIEAFLHDLPTHDEPFAATHKTPAAPVQPTIHLPSAAPVAATPTPATPIESEPPVYDTHKSAVLEPPSEVEHLMNFQPAASVAVAPSPVAASHDRASAQAPSSSPRSPRIEQAPPYRDGAPSARPAATISPEPAPSSINEPDLVALLTGSLAGSLALQARYPRQLDTQLILDQHGQLHLLRRQFGTDLKAALVDLIEARDWVTEHRQLIALTQRQCQFDMEAMPTLHLFTSDAKNAVAMVNKLGPFVKLHLLQEVRIGTAKTWVCTDLN